MMTVEGSSTYGPGRSDSDMWSVNALGISCRLHFTIDRYAVHKLLSSGSHICSHFWLMSMDTWLAMGFETFTHFPLIPFLQKGVFFS